jgi:excisionase family DNA binding protein
MAIRDLASHSARFVTIAELAEYWAVSRQQIYKRIESGALEGIRLGSRLYRVRTSAALEYERRASVTRKAELLPRATGPRSVLRSAHDMTRE